MISSALFLSALPIYSLSAQNEGPRGEAPRGQATAATKAANEAFAAKLPIADQKDFHLCELTDADVYFKLPESFKKNCTKYIDLLKANPRLINSIAARWTPLNESAAPPVVAGTLASATSVSEYFPQTVEVSYFDGHCFPELCFSFVTVFTTLGPVTNI